MTNTLIKLLRYFQRNLIIFTIFCVSMPCFGADYIDLESKIVADFSREFLQKKGLFLIGSGGAMMYNLQEISLTFACRRGITTIEDARRLYVTVVDEYLNRVNGNKNIRLYLDQYPFDWKNMNICILFSDGNSLFSTSGVAKVAQRKNGTYITYRGYDGDNLYPLHEETVEEAKALFKCTGGIQ